VIIAISPGPPAGAPSLGCQAVLAPPVRAVGSFGFSGLHRPRRRRKFTDSAN